MRQKAYYTADEIVTNLYTTGSQWMTEDLVEYKGSYHTYLTGEVYTQVNWIPDKSVKLIKFEKQDLTVTQYKKIKPINVSYNSIYSFYPTVTMQDIANKYVTRFFIKKINESAIIEIDEMQYTAWTAKKIDPNMYTAVKVAWQIAGPKVTAINAFRVKTAEKTIRGISQKLSNLSELYTDTEFVTPKDINH